MRCAAPQSTARSSVRRPPIPSPDRRSNACPTRPLRRRGWKSSVSRTARLLNGGSGLRRAVYVAAFLSLLGARLSSQAQTGSDNPDSLFNDGTAAAPPPTGQPAETPGAASVRPDDLLNDNKIHFFGSVDIYGLAGLGWSQFPQLAHLGDSFGPEGSGSLTTNIGFEVRPATELRIRGTLSYYFPTQGP